jgi:MFS family permease
MVLWLCEFSSVSAKHLFTLAQSICSHFSTHDERSPLECRYCTVSPSPYVTISWTSQLTSGANIIATAVAGLISAATFATLGGAHGIAGWRWLFIILGVVTFGIAIIALWSLPDGLSPKSSSLPTLEWSAIRSVSRRAKVLGSVSNKPPKIPNSGSSPYFNCYICALVDSIPSSQQWLRRLDTARLLLL